METFPFFLFPCILILLTSAPGVSTLGLRCSASGTTCSAFVSFVTRTPTSLSTIVTTFGLQSHRDLLGANAWNFSLPPNTIIEEKLMVKVPITCFCTNGSGTSKNGPNYTVVAQDSLSLIAETKYGGLLSYTDIVSVNSEIKNPDEIFPGQKFRIPLPCSCQIEREATTRGNRSLSSAVLHYSYLVQDGNLLERIAAEMGSSTSELMRVNNITDPKTLAAGQILDVPLKACSSNLSKSSRETNLLVANGTYVLTAENCLQCSCGPSDLDLYCAPAPLGASCPSMQCKNSNLTIGNFTTQSISGGCNVTECSYNGYVNKTILTILENSLQPQCPAKHILPALTTPATSQAPSQAPSPAASGPGISPSSSPGSSPNVSSPPSSPPSPPSSPPPSPSGSTNTMAVEPFKSSSLATMLVLDILFFIY